MPLPRSHFMARSFGSALIAGAVVVVAGCGGHGRTLSDGAVVAAIHAAGFKKVSVESQAKAYAEARKRGLPLSLKGPPPDGPDYFFPAGAHWIWVIRLRSSGEARPVASNVS